MKSRLIDRLKLIEELRREQGGLPAGRIPGRDEAGNPGPANSESVSFGVRAGGAGHSDVSAPAATAFPADTGADSAGSADWTEATPFVWIRRFPAQGLPSLAELQAAGSHKHLALYAKVSDFDPATALWYDTETMGLSTGAGTAIFLWGGLRYVDGLAQVTQIFLADFPGEPDFLRLVEAEVSSAAALVSFNGKSFDRALLRSRFILAGMEYPEIPELDLLHPSRALWRDSLPSCSLGSLEQHILGVLRGLDLPGELIPDRYSSYLRSICKPADSPDLAAVFEHHRQDLESLVLVSHRVGDILGLVLGNFTREAPARPALEDLLPQLREHRLQLPALLRIFDNLSRRGAQFPQILGCLCGVDGPLADAVTNDEKLCYRAAAAFTRFGMPMAAADLFRRRLELAPSGEALKRACLCLELACGRPAEALELLDLWGSRVPGLCDGPDGGTAEIWQKRRRRLEARIRRS